MGKTMMSIYLTEQLEQHTASIPGAELLFFFCNAQDKKRNTATAVLRGLVHQIVVKRPHLIKHALPYFETPERSQQTLSSLETLWIIFNKLVNDNELGTMFCVLDGLDECEETSVRILLPRVISLLAGEVSSTNQAKFKLIIISRDLPGLRGCEQVRLDPDNDEKVIGDIKLFVSARVKELFNIEEFNEEFRSSVQTVLLERAEGTFLWVGFAMYELSQVRTRSEVWETLENLPSGLPAIYSRMLLRIPANRREISRAILRWVTLAVRPLRLPELAAAIGTRSSSLVTIEQATHDAITHCGPLLKVQEQEVSLVHQSARDYLLRKEHESNAVLEDLRVAIEPSHLELAQKCLDCITRSGLQNSAFNLSDRLDPRESPLLPYATLYWPEHAKRCSALAAKLFDASALFFKKKSPLRLHWWSTWARQKYRRAQYNRPSLLHIACFFEIEPWVKATLNINKWRPRYRKRVDEVDACRKAALHWAAEVGNEALVRLLVNRGADVKMKDRDRRTVLHYAIPGHNEAVVQLLMDKGADVNARTRQGQPALLYAVISGNEAIAQLLIDKGADINARGIFGYSVLVWAIMDGTEAVVRLLINRGTDIEAKNSGGLTALHLACRIDNYAITKLLIDSGADLEAKSDDGYTALHLAKTEAMLRLLLDSGADFNAKTNLGLSVLQLVERWGTVAMAQLLRDRGAGLGENEI